MPLKHTKRQDYITTTKKQFKKSVTRRITLTEPEKGQKTL